MLWHRHAYTPVQRELTISDSVDWTPLCNNDDTTLDHNKHSPYEDCTQEIKSFFEHGCDCWYGKNQSPGTKSLNDDEVVDHRMQCIELSSPELDLVILGALRSHFNQSYEKECHRMKYFFRDMQVHRKRFLLVYGITKTRLENLKGHYKKEGLVSRTDTNTSWLPRNTLSR